MLRLAGVTLMVATRCCTTIWAVSAVPPASVATTLVVPLALAVTRPAAPTLAVLVVGVGPKGGGPAAPAPPLVSGAAPVSGEPARPAAVTVSSCAPEAPSVQL